MLLLDTHVLIWFGLSSSPLGRAAESAIQAKLATRQVAVSVFSYWELGMLVAKKRLQLDPLTVRGLALSRGIIEVQLDTETCIHAAALTGFHGDPADRLIVATAQRQRARLVTADDAILRWKSALPRFDART